MNTIIHLTNKILLYYHLLFLLQIVNHLLAVLPECVIADVYPIASRLWVVLPDELVELTMGLDPFEPPLSFLDVAIDAKVGCLSCQVLTVRYATHCLVQCLTPES